MTIIFLIYFGAFFPAKSSALHRSVVLGCSYAILLGFSFLNLSGLNLILYTLINFLLLYLLHRTKWYTACFHAIILSALMAACEILPIGILSGFNPTFLQYYDTFPYSFIFVIFSKGLFFIAAYLLIFFFKKEKYHPQKDWHSLLLLFTPVATIFTLATLIKVGEYVTFFHQYFGLHKRCFTLSQQYFCFWNQSVYPKEKYSVYGYAAFTAKRIRHCCLL